MVIIMEEIIVSYFARDENVLPRSEIEYLFLPSLPSYCIIGIHCTAAERWPE